MTRAPGNVQIVWPRPGRALKGVLLLIFGLWLMFAVAINWGGASERVFLLFCGNTELILQGQIWRLFTAPLLHPYSGSPFYVLTILLGFYFLSPSLEEAWGSARFLRFLASAAVTAYTFQLLLELILPASLSAKLVPDYWFGAIPVIEAIAIAWALNFKGRTVNLMFVLPVSSKGLILFVVAMSVLYLIAGAMGPAGLIAPFGGMLSGWLLGGKPSPLRQAWLKYRLARLDLEAKRARQTRRERVARSRLRAVRGEEDDQNGSPTNGGGGGTLN